MRMTLTVLLASLLTPVASAQGRKDEDEQRAVAAIKKLGGVVTVDPKSGRVVEVDFASPELTDEGLKPLKELKGLQGLDLGGTRVTDAGLQHLKGIKGLRELFLSRTAVTDEGPGPPASCHGRQPSPRPRPRRRTHPPSPLPRPRRGRPHSWRATSLPRRRSRQSRPRPPPPPQRKAHLQ